MDWEQVFLALSSSHWAWVKLTGCSVMGMTTVLWTVTLFLFSHLDLGLSTTEEEPTVKKRKDWGSLKQFQDSEWEKGMLYLMGSEKEVLLEIEQMV